MIFVESPSDNVSLLHSERRIAKLELKEVAAIDELITASGEISSAVVIPSIKSQAFS